MDTLSEGFDVDVSLVGRFYTRLLSAAVDETISYEELDGIAGSRRECYRPSLIQAIHKLERKHQGTFRCVWDVGYRRVPSEEHLEISDGYYHAALDRMKGAIRVAAGYDPAVTSEETKRRCEEKAQHYRVRRDALRNLTERRRRHREIDEKVVASKKVGAATPDLARIQSEMEELKRLFEQSQHSIAA